MNVPLYRKLAVLCDARNTCAAEPKRFGDWKTRHEETMNALVKAHMPSGSGFDNGTTIDFEASNAEQLVFKTAFHHMNEHGTYVGWTEHKVIVKASLAFGTFIKVTGRDRENIKEYILEVFETCLKTEVEEA